MATRLQRVAQFAKQAARMSPAMRQQLHDWERQFIDPLEYGAPDTQVTPEVAAQLQEALPGTDLNKVTKPSPWPTLLAMGALLGVGGGVYMLGRHHGK